MFFNWFRPFFFSPYAYRWNGVYFKWNILILMYMTMPSEYELCACTFFFSHRENRHILWIETRWMEINHDKIKHHLCLHWKSLGLIVKSIANQKKKTTIITYKCVFLFHFCFHSESMDWWEWAVSIVRSYSYQNKEYQSWITMLLLSWPTISNGIDRLSKSERLSPLSNVSFIFYRSKIVIKGFSSVIHNFDKNVVCMCGFMPSFISSYNALKKALTHIHMHTQNPNKMK